jgi:hypothetical protein
VRLSVIECVWIECVSDWVCVRLSMCECMFVMEFV